MKSTSTQGSKKTFFMDKPWACGLWNWTSPDFFQTSTKKTTILQNLLISRFY